MNTAMHTTIITSKDEITVKIKASRKYISRCLFLIVGTYVIWSIPFVLLYAAREIEYYKWQIYTALILFAALIIAGISAFVFKCINEKTAIFDGNRIIIYSSVWGSKLFRSEIRAVDIESLYFLYDMKGENYWQLICRLTSGRERNVLTGLECSQDVRDIINRLNDVNGIKINTIEDAPDTACAQITFSFRAIACAFIISVLLSYIFWHYMVGIV